LNPFIEDKNEKLSKYVYDDKGVFTVKMVDTNAFEFNKKEGGRNTIYFFRAKSILYHLIKKSNENNLNKYAFGISVAIGILRGYLPTLGYLEKWSILPGADVFEKVILLILNCSLIHMYMYVTRFVIQIILDYRRKIYIMKCLKSLISPHKVYKKKLFPTLNLLDKTSASSWYKMRKVVHEYGNNMDMRHMLLIPALFLYMVFIQSLNWIKNFQLIKLEKSFIGNLAPFLNIDFIIFCWLIVVLLFELAGLNMMD
jgi:hypothetical protein